MLALTLWLAIPVLGFARENLAPAIVWKVGVGTLPLFIVLFGYHPWRRVCPLAFFSQIAQRLRRPGTRRASLWLQNNYYYVSFAFFFFSLWLRLTVTNLDARALSIFFIAISLGAVLTGAVFTGKTWCNYICPLSFIEKIYTEPSGLRQTQSSQCSTCTACKTSCPDINEEYAFWKEIKSQPKRTVYFAFPGLVFGFFFYYFLQAGTWDHYMADTSWTSQQGNVIDSFTGGHGFAFGEAVPVALAAFATLALSSLTTILVFSCFESVLSRWSRRRRGFGRDPFDRSATFTLAAFVAFMTFYVFAVYPSLPGDAWLTSVVKVIALTTATLSLFHRFRRDRVMSEKLSLSEDVALFWDLDGGDVARPATAA